MKYFIILTAILISINALAVDLQITSSPEKAEVRISTLQNKSPTKAGETPYKTSLTDVKNSYAAGSDMVVIEVIKEGHETYRLVLPLFMKSDVKLDVVLTPKADWDEVKKIDKVMSELFEVQRMIRGQNYTAAAQKLNEVEKTYPRLSITKELKASSFYLQNDYRNALDYYKQAYFANTENIDAYKMMTYLEKSLDVKRAKDTPK